MFEDGVHAYFTSLTEPTSFTIRSLENPSEFFEITFPPHTSCSLVHTKHTLCGLLSKYVEKRASCYLRPDIPTQAAFDSFLYQSDMNQPNLRPLLPISISTTGDHPISVTGCRQLQEALAPKNDLLKELRPLVANKWPILFIVPEEVEAGFLKQSFKVPERTPDHEKEDMVNVWLKKTSQYVLAFPQKMAMQGGARPF
jgi:hypothetical protein